MEKVAVELKSTQNYYMVIRKIDQKHIKSVRTQYVAELIEKYGIIYYFSLKKEFTPGELCFLAAHHYRELGKCALVMAGQYEMAIKLNESKATHKKLLIKIDQANETAEKCHSIIFSSGLEINVSEYHYRMFSSLPNWRVIPNVPIQEKLFI